MYKKSQHTLFFYAKCATWLNNWSIIRSPSRSLDFRVLENCVRQPAWDKQLCHGKEVNQIAWFVNRCKSALDISFAGWGMGHSTEHCLSTLSYRCVCLINHSQTRLQGLKKNEEIYIGTFQAFYVCVCKLKFTLAELSIEFPRYLFPDGCNWQRWIWAVKLGTYPWKPPNRADTNFFRTICSSSDDKKWFQGWFSRIGLNSDKILIFWTNIGVQNQDYSPHLGRFQISHW